MTTEVGPASTTARALSKFDDCATLLTRIRSAAGAHVTAFGLTGAMPGVVMSASAAGSAAPAAGMSASSPGASVPFSTTNVQEAGADEPDIVKNTATVGFTLFEGRLRSLRISPGAVAMINELALDVGDRAEMLLVDDRLVVLSQAATDGRPVTRMRVIDARNPGALRVVSESEIDGTYVSARRIGSTVRLVVTRPGPVLPFVFAQSADDVATAEALRQNRALVDRSQLTDWLPGATIAGRAASPAVSCAETYMPQSFAGPGSTAVLTMSPRDGRILHSTAVLATSSEVYATSGRLYLATSAWRPVLGAVTTEIHRFDVSDPRQSVYEASGSVPGRLLRAPWFVPGSVLGQWALSEHNGDLRVATTRDHTADNGITVLRRVRDQLVPVGAVAGLGRGEQLYAVRFMGDRAYVVTYRKVDPLYVVDLSNVVAPRVLGELKIPGYSVYLHPVGESLLLGIGQDDPNEDGLADGTQVSLFDVGDASRPQRVAHIKLGDRGTVAGVEADHRAFTWWPNPGRAIVTLSNFSDPRAFHGAVGIDVGARSLREIGRVEHAGPEGSCAALVTRSRVLGASVLTFSAIGVKVNALDDLSPRSSLGYATANERPSCSQNAPPPPRPTSTTTTSTTAVLGGFGGD